MIFIRGYWERKNSKGRASLCFLSEKEASREKKKKKKKRNDSIRTCRLDLCECSLTRAVGGAQGNGRVGCNLKYSEKD